MIKKLRAFLEWLLTLLPKEDELEEEVELQVLELPEGFLFDWKRDYGSLWYPGSTAFWLAPEPGDLKAGRWPLPFIKARPPEFDFEIYCDLTEHDQRELQANPYIFARPKHPSRIEVNKGAYGIYVETGSHVRLRGVRIHSTRSV